jgi:DNA polymerase III delta prime subunit
LSSVEEKPTGRKNQVPTYNGNNNSKIADAIVSVGGKNINIKNMNLGLPRELAKRELIESFAEPLDYNDCPSISGFTELWQIFQSLMTTMKTPYIIISGIKYVGKTTFIRNIAKAMKESDGNAVKMLDGRTVMRILPEVTSSTLTPESEAFMEYVKEYKTEDCKGIVLYTDDQQVAGELLSTPGMKIPIIVEADDSFNITKINIHTNGGYPILRLNPDTAIKDNIDLLCGIVEEKKDEYMRKFGWVPSRNVVSVITKATTIGATSEDYSITDALFVIDSMCSEFASTHNCKRKPTMKDAYRFIKDSFGIDRKTYDDIPDFMPEQREEEQEKKDSSKSTGADKDGFAFKDRADLENKLKSRVIGQDEAIEKIIAPIIRRKAGLSDDTKPIANMLFAGPSGVGKTEAAKALASALFDDEKSFKRIDCGELNTRGSSSRLLGTTQGYLGYDKCGELSDFIYTHPHSVVLFDEIEKAEPALYDSVLLQLLDSGRLTGTVKTKGERGQDDVESKTIDATGCVIIMTSNLGSDMVGDYGMETHGFGIHEDNVHERLRQDVMTAVEHQFRTEQVNRFDQIIIFNTLDEQSLEKVFKLKWSPFCEKLNSKGIKVTISDDVPRWFADKSRKDKFGARNLLRTMNANLINHLADGIVDGSLKKNILVKVHDKDIVME